MHPNLHNPSCFLLILSPFTSFFSKFARNEDYRGLNPKARTRPVGALTAPLETIAIQLNIITLFNPKYSMDEPHGR